MSNRKKIASVAFTGAATAAAVTGFNVTPAFAATHTWHVTPHGKFSAPNSGVTSLHDSTNGNTLTCTQASTAGSLSKASVTQSNSNPIKAGFLSKANFGTTTHCAGPLGTHFSAHLKTANHPNINVSKWTGPVSKGVTHGTITGISASIKSVGGTGCVAHVTNIGGTAMSFSYHNSTGKLNVNPGKHPVLTVKSTAGTCLGLRTGDKTYFHGTFLPVIPPTSSGVKPIVSRI